jgi:hypothetical protein
LDFFQALAADICSVDDLELTPDFFFEFLRHSLALSVVHSVKFLLLLPEILEGLFYFFVKVVMVFDFALGGVAVDFFIEEKFFDFDFVVPAGNFLFQVLFDSVVIDDAINVIEVAVDIDELRFQVSEELIKIDRMLACLFILD